MADSKSKDLGAAEVQKKTDDAESKGFLGQTVDDTPNSAYSLESGPEGVPLHEDHKTRNGQVSS